MGIPGDFMKALDKHLELAGDLLEQASVMKTHIDELEKKFVTAAFESKLAFYAMRERYAKSMLLLFKELTKNTHSTNYAHKVDGERVEDIEPMYVWHLPSEWVEIWQRVYDKVHKYYKNIRLQYAYNRNPREIKTSPTIIVNKD